MELGKRIKQLRLRSGLTQEALAERLGVVAQSVSKWETSAAMPDISTLPILAETFGVSIDDLFDLTAEQRLSRIENRLDAEDDIPGDVFSEYAEFLESKLNEEKYKKRATGLIAYLFWHKMNAYAEKVKKYAHDAIRLAPGEKGCQWMLNMAEGDAAWDWNCSNHLAAIEFYRELSAKHPDLRSPYLYLLDNLIADRRADEAEEALGKLRALKDADPVICEIYAAHIALARFDKEGADKIIEDLLASRSDDFACLFEAAQYYASTCEYDKAIALYERSFEHETRRPRYYDELQAIAQIYEIKGDYANAAATYDRIIALLRDEWGMTEEVTLKEAEMDKSRLSERINLAERQ
ncbi:MAG: helix-turn-helix domain-containing protein [Clostridia bacterium]|nr:helix-turn-helix domain-containing protein [Clostridia bacterium]